MMTFKKAVTKLVVFVVFLQSPAILAQDWKNDLLEMNKAYINASSFRMDVEVRSYSKASDPKPVFNYKGSAAGSGSNYYTSMLGRITIVNKHCLLVVDNSQKMILYRKTTQPAKPNSGFSLANIDSAMVLMGKHTSVKYLQNNTTSKIIELSYKDNALAKVQIAIDPVSYLLKEIVYYYNTGSVYANAVEKVVISYNNVELNKTIPDSFFSENNYVTARKSGFVPLKKYEKYEVVNQSHL